MACGPARCLASSCLVVSLPRVARRVRRRPAAYRPQGLSIPRRRQFQGHYSAPFSSAHLTRPGSSPHPPHSSPSHPGKQAGRARRRAVIGGSRHRHRIPAPSRLRPVSPLVSACGAKIVSFPSVSCRHRARASPHRSPWLKRFNHSSARARSHPGQTSRQGRPVPRSVPRVGRREAIGHGQVIYINRAIHNSDTIAHCIPVPPHFVSSYPPRLSCRRAGRFHPSRRIASLTRVGERGEAAPFRSAHRGSLLMRKRAGSWPVPSSRFYSVVVRFVSRSNRRCSGWLRCCRRWKQPPW